MPAAFMNGSGWNLSVNQDWINVTSEYPTPDERWRFTDSNGHEHHYDHGYPTLDLVIDREHWCLGNEGLYSHDEHMAVDESHFECKQCREIIEPSQHPGGWPQHIPGMRTATLKGRRSSGVTVEVLLVDDELEALTSATDDARSDLAQRLLNDVPDDRVLSWENTFAPR